MKRCIKLVGLTFLFLVISSFFCWVFMPSPNFSQEPSYSTVYLDNQDNVLRMTTAQDERYRLYTPFEDIPAALVDATVLYEDQHFYQHKGVDFTAVFRAAWQSFFVRKRRVGASTITMQLARKHWGINSKTLTGKATQIFRAFQLSRHFSKSEILERYFNIVSYGGNIEGIGAASRIYFNKPPSKLSELEALSLAVIPQNPNKRNPAKPAGLDALYPARNLLIDKLIKDDSSKKYLIKYKNLPLAVRSPKQLPFYAPHFVDFIHKKSHIGVVKTTLNLAMQRQVEALVSAYLEDNNVKGITNAAVLIVNHKNTSIEAMVGSADYNNVEIAGQVNGTLAKRSPGSTLKPLLFGLAFDEGLIHPLSLMKDTARQYAGFSPENFDKKFLGPVPASKALVLSRNVPAVFLQSELIKKHRSPFFYDFLKRAGISRMRPADFYGLALSLGGMEVSMLELARLYTMLANAGDMYEINGILSPGRSRVRPKKLLSSESAYLVLDILKTNRAPDNRYQFTSVGARPVNEIAWKTGTSWAYRDAWSVGVSKDYVVAVWLGDFRGLSNPALVGRSAAGPLLFNIFDRINKPTDWKIDDLFDMQTLNLKTLKVCGRTGDLDTKYCPKTANTLFIPGVSPIRSSYIYRQVAVDKKTGLRSCQGLSTSSVNQVFEFWPSDLLEGFRRAGLKVNTPPSFMPQCALDKRFSQGGEPVIASPVSTLQYVMTASTSPQFIEFRAVTDTGAKVFRWFVDEVFTGEVKINRSLLWPMQPGRKVIKVVDDLGQVASVTIQVIQQ